MKVSTPRAPGAPHATPMTGTTTRAPIHNPYDKFSQPEFDAWIGDITGALKRALGQEAPSHSEHSRDYHHTDSYASDDDIAEDSFAEIKARRAAKGKQRAKDLEDESGYEMEEPTFDQQEEEADETGQEVDALYSLRSYARWPEVDDQEIEDGSDYESDSSSDNTGQAIEISSDEDELDDDSRTRKLVAEPQEGSIRYNEQGEESAAEEEESDTPDVIHEEMDELDEEFIPEEENVGPGSHVEIPDVWSGPSRYAEDFYSGGDVIGHSENPHVLPAEAEAVEDFEEDEDIEETHDAIYNPPAPLPDVEIWSGSQSHALNPYVDVIPATGPHALSPLAQTTDYGDSDDDADIALVITPGVLSPSPQEISSPVLEASPEDDIASGTEPPTFFMTSASEERHAMDDENLYQPPGGSSATDDFDDLYASVLDENLPEAQADILREGSKYTNGAPHTPERSSAHHALVAHDRSLSPPRSSPSGHINWSWPPAFPTRRPASPAKSPLGAPDAREVVEISDEEEEDEVVGPAPLGTSDLDIPSDFQSVSGDDDNTSIEQEPASGNYVPDAHIVDFNVFSDQGPMMQDSLYSYADSERSHIPLTEASDAPRLDLMVEEEQFEPVITPGAGFGDMPPKATGADASFLIRDVDILETLVKLGSEATEIAQHTPSADSGGRPDAEPAAGSADIPFGEDSQADNGTILEMLTESSYVILEPEEQALEKYDDIGVVEVTDVSVPDIHATNAVVEEVDTEGRQTEEPDAFPVIRSMTPPLPIPDGNGLTTADVDVIEQVALTDVAITEDEGVAGASIGAMHGWNQLAKDVVDQTYTSSEVSTGVTVFNELASRLASEEELTLADRRREDSIEASATNLPMDVDSEHNTANQTVEHPPSFSHFGVNAVESSGPQRTLEDTVDPINHSHFMLQPGVPMPISADPSVPDPASPHASAGNSSRVTDIADDADLDDQYQNLATANKAFASAIRPSLLRQLSGHKTISGLFTPLSEASSPPSPLTQNDQDPLPESAIEVDSTVADSAVDVDGPSSMPDDPSDSNAASVVDTRPTNVQQPPPTETLATSSATNATPIPSLGPPTANATQLHVDDDADADGDIDPDYAPPKVDIQDLESPCSPDSVESRIVPELVTPSDIPDIQVNGQPSADNNTGAPAPPYDPILSHEPLSTFSHADEATSNEHNPGSVPPTSEVETRHSSRQPSPLSDVHSDMPSRSTKRKRTSPARSVRMTRSRSARMDMVEEDNTLPSQDVAKTKSAKSKGKERAREDVVDFDILQSSAGNGHNPLSRNGSRASSVASTSISDNSTEAPSSPAPEYQGLQPTASLPLMHAHGGAHHDRSNLPRLPPLPAPTQAAMGEHSRPSTQLPEPIQPVSKPVVHSIPSSSPVTRSNCRFHKISLPQEEKTARVFFVVPGCSLNHELMEDEDIQDHGDATGDDRQYLIPDVESIGLNPYVIGLLRQLVGVDLLREQEVFYLPQRGDRRRKPRKSLKPRLSAVDSISSRIGSGSSTVPKTMRGRTRGTPSAAASRSASVARSDHMSGMSTRSTVTSASDNEASDHEGNVQPQSSESIPRDAISSANSTTAGTTEPPKRPMRRSRRLQPDALAYKPPQESDNPSSDDEQSNKRNKKARRGIKRTRTADHMQVDDAEDANSPKKRKLSTQSSADVDPSKNHE